MNDHAEMNGTMKEIKQAMAKGKNGEACAPPKVIIYRKTFQDLGTNGAKLIYI